MTLYTDNKAGSTITTGQDDYVVSGSIEQYDPILGSDMVDGGEYAMRVAYADVADGSDYETVTGIWNAGTNTLTRVTVSTSSNAGAKVNWGVGTKVIYIVADSELLTDMEQMVEGATKKILTVAERANIAASKTKTDLITVTQAVNLDQMEADIAAASAGMVYKGDWDATTLVFPGGGTANIGDFYYVSVGGTVGGVEFTVGDNIVAVANNASTTIYAGYWSKHDQSDAVQAVAGLTGSISAYQLKAALPVTDPWSDKPEGEPVIILMFGDSNCTGVAAAVPGLQSSNSNVYVWQADFTDTGPGTAYDPSTLTWRNIAPSATSRIYQIATAGTAGVAYAGLIYGDGGMTAWAIGDRIQKRTGRPVYIYSVGMPGSTLKYWKNPLDANAGALGQAGYTAINHVTQGFDAAMAAVPGSQTYADIVFMSCGTNDCGAAITGTTGYSASTYASDFTSVYDLFVTEGWIDKYKSLFFMSETPQTYTNYSGRQWMGHQYVSNAAPNNVILLSSYGVPVEADNIHFTAYALNQFGNVAADMAFSGLGVPTFVRNSNYVEQVSPALRGNLTSTTGVMTSTVAATGGTDVAWSFNTPAYADTDTLFQIQNNGSTKALVTGVGGLTVTGALASTKSGATFFTDFIGYCYTDLPFAAQSGYKNFIADGGSAIAHSFDTGSAFSTAGALLASFKNNGTAKFTIDKDGYLGKTTVKAPQVTHTSLPSSTATITNATETLDYASPGIGEQFKVAGTYVFNAGNSGSTGSAISVANAYSNTTSSALNFNIPASVRTNSTFTAANAASAALTWNDVVSQINTAASGGSGAGTVTLLNHFYSDGAIGASTTVTYRTVFSAANLTTVTGTLTNQVGFASSLTGATNNTHLLMGSALPTAGQYAIYQADSLVNRWGGGHRFAYRASNATTINMTVADHILKVTTTSGPATVNLPTAIGNAGLHFIIKRTGTQNVTVDGNSSETIDGTTTKTIGTADHVLEIVSDGANWLCVKGPGAP